MEGNSSNWNDDFFEELDPELQAVDRLLREDGARFREEEEEGEIDPADLRAQFDRLIERLEREPWSDCESDS